MKKFLFPLIIPLFINAAEINQAELNSFVKQKYKLDYNVQTQENKDKLKKEYNDTLKLLNYVSNDIKNDPDYKVAKTLLAINVWSNKYVENLKINDQMLQELYEKKKPKIAPTYNLYNILISDKKKAEEIFTLLEKLPKESRLNEFKKQAKSNSQDSISIKNEGNIGWIEIQKLDKRIQEKIKDKNANDLVMLEMQNVGYQIILINDFKPGKELSFAESKEFLINFIKQQELIKKVNGIIN